MNRVSEILGIQYPIIQAPMAWGTSAELVAAVSNAGGLGILGSHAGQNKIAIDPVDIGERLRNEIIKTKQITDKPFGVNYMLSEGDLENHHPISQEILKICNEENIKILAAVGIPNKQGIKRLKELGFTILFREGSPTVLGAQIAENAGADIIIATGFEAGGVAPIHPIPTASIVKIILDAVNIPVIAAGGITDKTTVDAVFALGAEGIYMGTRFLATKESPASDVAKQDIIEYGNKEIVSIKTGFGSLRSTPHTLALQAEKLNAEGKLAQLDSIVFKLGIVDGKLEEGLVTISSKIDSIKTIKTCKEIIDELMKDVMIERK
ncbi:nitronate monooxygenase [Paenibacillus sp. PsM32]|uniref:NAD(P)H-dependent flavin oxidoreductase n=1 Tax=Paenibacillus sp. PsM32 TaxID=3030536 RepID=UPI00263B18AF|nr:nitronate monooxygenase [Paenibacillus sp. PsM32]MDN4618414.1 nitronate monooxygenase [Paenibacillus sp. PsM32]